MTRPNREEYRRTQVGGFRYERYAADLEAYIDHLEELAEKRLCRIKGLLAEASYINWEEDMSEDL